MGAMCVSEEVRLQRQAQMKAAQQAARKRNQELNNGIYAQKVRLYTKFYGRIVDDQTKKFIEDNYNSNYSSEVRSAGYPRYGQLILTYKSSLIDRFQTAFKKRYSTRKVEFIKKESNYITFVFETSFSTYDVTAYFDEEDKFKSMIFNERYKSTPVTYYPPAPSKPKNDYYDQPSSNNYQGPTTDWGAHYAAEVARSNQKFRDNMNKQAEQWNNYQRQKANRGW